MKFPLFFMLNEPRDSKQIEWLGQMCDVTLNFLSYGGLLFLPILLVAFDMYHHAKGRGRVHDLRKKLEDDYKEKSALISKMKK